MKKRISLPMMVLIAFCVAAVTFESTYIFCVTKAKLGEDEFKNEKLAYVDKLYRERFIGDIDEDKLTDYLIRGYLVGAGERFGGYYTADEYAVYLSDVSGSSVGIGVTVSYDEQTGLALVSEVTEGAPAQRAGITPGDLISKVNGESCKELGYYDAVTAIKGEEGTDVSVTVLRDGKEITFDITREQIKEQCVYYHKYADTDIGVIRITRFATVASEQFADALNILKSNGARKLVFDLRDNPGGDLDSVTSILDLLLPEGNLVITTDKNGNETVVSKSDAQETDMPMAVIVNGNSASASELFAANIRDYDKGKIIGETTYGKGTMQSSVPLPDGSCIMISNYKFASASGINYDGVGITPDIELKPNDLLTQNGVTGIDEKDDNQLTAAVEYLTKLN